MPVHCLPCFDSKEILPWEEIPPLRQHARALPPLLRFEGNTSMGRNSTASTTCPCTASPASIRRKYFHGKKFHRFDNMPVHCLPCFDSKEILPWEEIPPLRQHAH